MMGAPAGPKFSRHYKLALKLGNNIYCLHWPAPPWPVVEASVMLNLQSYHKVAFAVHCVKLCGDIGLLMQPGS